ncbi:ER protein BIG1 [Purpureocillium lavendulum]|uniref:AC9 transposase n=1 Tax=Purpureocillium lavendulum TaxID=1247861 RepID=A0AB34FCA5_9HYPO|nr:calnexin precursor [Purpureocillium lavendulum]KAJ6436885.1 putative AC9 transposase [Purpureocillium lavendulum]KAJ6437967.1 ER protein BIG1 [Purpureocillium lavendulum]
MAPIDYSKWDNIDTDSEPEAASQRASAAKSGPPAVSASPHLDTSAAAGTPTNAGHVDAVIVRCEVEKRRFPLWSATTISGDHPIFSGQVPPIPGLIGLPLVLHRVGTESVNRADLDNQIATYLNVDADSGYAPPEWQSHVGTVVVARKDRRPLLPQHLEGIWMFCDHILDLFGDGEGPPRWLYSRQGFEKWWRDYCEEQKHLRPGDGGERDPDDWHAVRSPYEV